MKKFNLLILAFLFATSAIAQAPVIASFSPVIATPGQTVTISGIYFNDTIANVTVFFGKIKGTVLTTSFSQITVTVPYGASVAPIGVTVHHLNGISKLNFTPSFAGNSQPLSAANFSAPIRIPYYAENNSLFLADIDGDGKLDIVTLSGSSRSGSTYANSIAIYRNINTPGQPVTAASFATPLIISTGTTWSIIYKIIDYDGDGKLDIFFTGSNNVLFNTSTIGSLSFNVGTMPGNSYATEYADVDGDGKLDFVLPGALGGYFNVQVYQNTSYPCSSGSGWCNNVSLHTIRSSINGGVASIGLRDLTGDFKPELFISHLLPYTYTVRNSDTTFIFQNALYALGTIDSSAYPVAVVYKDKPGYGSNYFVDFDGDGQIDWLKFNNYNNGSTAMVYYKNNSYASTIINNSFFSTPYIDSSISNYYYNSIEITDLNGDGKPDVAGAIGGTVYYPGYAHGITAITNLTGSGVYSGSSFIDTNIVPIATGYSYMGFAIGDLDQDSRPDIVYSNNDTAINILRNITPILKPTVQASGVTISSISNTYMNVSWINGNGAGRIVLAKPVSALTDTPSGYSVYTANSVFGSGSLIGTSTRVVYIGTGNNVTISGLTPGVLYRFAVFEYNGFGTVLNYLTTSPGAGSATTLPVKLISFTAEKQKEDVLLHWQTASELNNDYFEVERCSGAQCLVPGAQSTSHNAQWEMVGKVKGHGTTNSLSNYQFVDDVSTPLDMTNLSTNQPINFYYRLKQIDFDGKFEYSKIVSVEFSQTQIPELVIYPNPNSSEFEIKITALNNPTTLEIFDMIGNKVHEEILNSTTTQLHLNNLNKGIYFLRCDTSEGVIIKKIIIE